MSEVVEPIRLRPRPSSAGEPTSASSYSHSSSPHHTAAFAAVCFNRRELNLILALYGRKVAGGEWRDYALDMGREKAVFSVFRRSSEVPLYRVEKNPKLAAKQGAFSVVAASGLILKRGQDLARVLAVLDKPVRAVG